MARLRLARSAALFLCLILYLLVGVAGWFGRTSDEVATLESAGDGEGRQRLALA